MLVDYVRHAHPRIALIGLHATLALLKGSTDQRRAVMALNGFRGVLEAAGKAGGEGEEERKVLVSDILERWKTRRRA